MKKTVAIILIALILISGTASADWWTDFWNFWKSISPFAVAPTCTGFTAISSSTTNIVSNIEDLKGTWLQTVLVADCGGESLTGSFSPEYLGSLSGTKLSRGFIFRLEGIEETANYEVINDAEGVWKYNHVCDWSYDSGTKTGSTGCSSLVTDRYNIGSCSYACWGRGFNIQQAGVKGHLSDPKVLFKAKVVIETLDGTERWEEVISSTDLVASLKNEAGEIIATVTWVGSLVTGDAPPSAQDYIAVYSGITPTWKLALAKDWLNYKTQEVVAKAELANPSYCIAYIGVAAPSNCVGYVPALSTITPANSYSDKLLSSDLKIGDTALQTRADGSGALPFSLKSRLNNPQLLLRIRGDVAGILIPSSKVEVASPQAVKFNLGETGMLNVDVKNIGTAEGMFYAKLSGCEPFTAGQTGLFTIFAGQTATVPLSVSYSGASISAIEQKTCTVSVCDRFDKDCATASASLTITPSKVCVPNAYEPLGNTLYKCSADGFSRNIALSCNNIEARTIGETYYAAITNSLQYRSESKSLNGGWLCSITEKNCTLDEKKVEKKLLDPRCDPKLAGCYEEIVTIIPAPLIKEGECTYRCVDGKLAELVSCGKPPIQESIIDAIKSIVVKEPVVSTATAVVATTMPKPTVPSPPGFEAVFALAGLLAVAYMTQRKCYRKKQ